MAHSDTASPLSATTLGVTLIKVLKKIPAWVYALLVVAAVGWNCWTSALAMGKGTVAYALDDPYIHMAIAKNLAFHGVWGVNPFEHVSASSSPGWILILAPAFKILGNHGWIPLVLNILAAVALAYVLDRILKPYAPRLWVRALLVTAVLLLLPVTLFVAMGMEHTLQALLVAVFFAFARKIFSPGYRPSKRECLWLFGLSACMVLVRVEDFVLLPVPFIYLLLKKDFRPACALFAGPLAALGLFAAIAYTQGFGIEPTSMLVKRVHLGAGESAAGKLLGTIWTNVAMFRELALFIAALLAIFLLLAIASKGRTTSMLLVGTALFGFAAHAANGAFGWFFRYEGYLILFSVLCLVAACSEELQVIWSAERSAKLIRNASGEFGSTAPSGLSEIGRGRLPGLRPSLRILAPLGLPRNRRNGAKSATPLAIASETRVWAIAHSYAIWALAVFAFGALIGRAAGALQAAPELMMNIGWQQLQMGRFLSRYYNGGNVMLNDIGAVNYLGDFHMTDIVGLGTPEIARARVDGKLDAAFVRRLLVERHVDVAMLYPGMLPPVPDGEQYPLIQVATWTLPRENSLVVPEVMIYATSRPAAQRLRRDLREFQAQLPAGVKVEYTSFKSVIRRGF